MGKAGKLTKARRVKNDEFYTHHTTVDKELRHYTAHFDGATVLCNCDDPRGSAFWYYFARKFAALKLKKLVAVRHALSPLPTLPLFDKNKAYVWEYVDGDATEEQREKCLPTNFYELEGDGDFRSGECEKLLQQADIVCTNPPFSLFREYINQLMDANKKWETRFLVIGNFNAVTYSSIFPRFQSGEMWLGVEGWGMHFHVTKEYAAQKNIKKNADGELLYYFRNTAWFTNLTHAKRADFLTVVKKYRESAYPQYDNYPAISVDDVKNIPADYDGEMGVPITYLPFHNPKQFVLVGRDQDAIGTRFIQNGKTKFARLLIKHNTQKEV